ncbi:MAG: DUF2807 domain-containing protein [Saprospiraceae bacterium]|nr:DUF2807 domain-containing protein [Saprospiraceae bacterium]
MKNLIVFVVAIGLLNSVSVLAQEQWRSIEGSGNIVNVKPDVIDFDKIEVDFSAKVLIRIGQAKSLDIEIDDNLSDFLLIQGDNKEHKLTFKLDKKKLGSNTWLKNNNIVIKVTMPEMSVYTQKSNGEAQIVGLNGRYFRAENFGNGDILLRGSKVDVLDIDLKGNGDVDAVDLTAAKAKVNLKGNGNVRFNASETYEVDLYGNGDVENTGLGIATRINRVGNGSVKSNKMTK